MQNTHNKNKQAALLLAFALLAAALLYMQSAIYLLLADADIIQATLTKVVTCAPWALGLWLLGRARRRYMPAVKRPVHPVLLGLTVILCAAISYSWLGGFGPYKEFTFALRYGYGRVGSIVTGLTLQYLYYALQAGLMVYIAQFAQAAGEAFTGKDSLFYGSAGLVALWGLYHLYSQGLANGLAFCLLAFFAAMACYAAGGKHWLAWLAMFLCLVL